MNKHQTKTLTKISFLTIRLSKIIWRQVLKTKEKAILVAALFDIFHNLTCHFIKDRISIQKGSRRKKKLLLVSKPKHIGSISCKNKSMSSVQKNNFRKRTNLSIHVLHASGGTILCYFWRIVKVQNTRWWQHRQSRQKRTIIGIKKKIQSCV